MLRFSCMSIGAWTAYSVGDTLAARRCTILPDAAAATTVGQRISALRGAMSLEKLAEKSGVSKSHLWNIEQGRKDPTTGVLEKIAEALGVTLRELMPDPQPTRKPTNIAD